MTQTNQLVNINREQEWMTPQLCMHDFVLTDDLWSIAKHSGHFMAL